MPEACVRHEDGDSVVGEAGVLHQAGGIVRDADFPHEDGGVVLEAGGLHEDCDVLRGAELVLEDGGVVREAGVLHKDRSIDYNVVACGVGIVGSAGVVI